jgi:hypothetical protein
LRYEQDCCRNAAVAQERRRHEEAAERAAALAARADALAGLALAVGPRARPCFRTGRRNIPRTPSSSVKVPPPTYPNLLPGGGRTGCSIRGPRACLGAPSTRGCGAGRAVHCELSCGQATPPRGSVAEFF